MKVQMQGVAAAPLDSDYGRAQWRQLLDGPVLKPELPWDRHCIEAASVMERGGKLWMFYAGGYNNEPQQIGCDRMGRVRLPESWPREGGADISRL